VRIDKALCRLERVKIRIGDSNVPRNQTIRSDFDALFRHDDCTVQEREIADCACSLCANRERTPSVTGNVIAKFYCGGSAIAQKTKDLRRLAVKAFAKDNVGRNRVLPPIILYAALIVDVAHDGKLPAE
jgi:hypothetical protein